MVVFRHDLQGFLSNRFRKRRLYRMTAAIVTRHSVSQNVYRNSTIATVDRYRLKPSCAVLRGSLHVSGLVPVATPMTPAMSKGAQTSVIRCTSASLPFFARKAILKG
ncbi:hypothetical protein EVAR_102022_1 [Eumeta japonica]|uniref:Uncharacterized protein n=1 Tax=Eumeta variegata TaxID=151549 RepID=A0A4C1U0Y6_EUMVA|nr:hypothetical protein EVAR_102022_1 [Eumeta japonica]